MLDFLGWCCLLSTILSSCVRPCRAAPPPCRTRPHPGTRMRAVPGQGIVMVSVSPICLSQPLGTSNEQPMAIYYAYPVKNLLPIMLLLQ